MQGVPPKLIRSDEEVAAMRQARAQQMQQAQAMQMMQAGAEVAATGAKAVKDAAGASAGMPPEALQQVMGGMGGGA